VGDDNAFKKLARINMLKVNATALAIVKNHFDTANVVQTSFIKA
jgi:hypothetical protein